MERSPLAPGEGTWSVFAEKVVRQRDDLRDLLREVYETQPAACVGQIKKLPGGGIGPCGECLWCRVRAALSTG